MSKQAKKLIVITLITIAIATVLILVRQGTGQQLSTELFIDPSSQTFNVLVVGQRFNVNVTVMNVTDLRSAEFNLTFNPAVLAVVGESFLPEANLPNANCNVNGTTGTFWANITYDNSLSTINPVAIATITFKIANYGICPLSFATAALANSTSLIPFQAFGGSVSVLLHDVAITELDTSTNETYEGNLVNVTATAENLGMAPENFTVTVYANTTIIGTYPILNLQPNQTVSLTVNWNTSNLASMTLYPIEAQASAVPYETNLTNNVLVNGTVKVKIIGDINGDGKVDLNDLIAWDAAYGSRPGAPNWNVQADINGDGVVDKADGILIIENYGNSL